MSNCIEIANSFMTGQAKAPKFNLDLTKITNIEIEGIDHRDYPDYCDAFISHGEYEGRELTDEELDYINMHEGMFVRQTLENYLW